jgi:hypothetical protein
MLDEARATDLARGQGIQWLEIVLKKDMEIKELIDELQRLPQAGIIMFQKLFTDESIRSMKLPVLSKKRRNE